jgi:hypothetical protein
MLIPTTPCAGPRRYDDLPVSKLPTEHADPKIAEGFARIAALDEALREAALEAAVVARCGRP